MNTRPTNPDFLNGVPELVLLRLLEVCPMHGYDLVQAIRRTSGGKLNFPEGSIYPVLHRLEADKLLASRRESAGGRSRIVYRLTPRGQARLTDVQAKWRQTVAGIQAILSGDHDVQPSLA